MRYEPSEPGQLDSWTMFFAWLRYRWYKARLTVFRKVIGRCPECHMHQPGHKMDCGSRMFMHIYQAGLDYRKPE